MGQGIMLCDDLIFFSRVAATAQSQGLTVAQARTPAALLDQARSTPPSAVILDLQHESLNLPQLLNELRAACPMMPNTVAFGSHVLADVLRAARQAGCQRVLARSQFVEQLATQLPTWLTPPPATSPDPERQRA